MRIVASSFSMAGPCRCLSPLAHAAVLHHLACSGYLACACESTKKCMHKKGSRCLVSEGAGGSLCFRPSSVGLAVSDILAWHWQYLICCFGAASRRRTTAAS